MVHCLSFPPLRCKPNNLTLFGICNQGVRIQCHSRWVGGPDQDNQRRPSLKVGGNLMNEVHKEAAYVGDNDEVDEDEWT